MSSSSLYEPEEDEDASDSDFDAGPARRTNAPPSFPPAEGLQQSSGEANEQSPLESISHTRSQALESLRMSLAQESVTAYGNLLDTTPDDNSPIQTGEIVSTPAKEKDYKGIVLWTPTEKEVFFNVLERKGKNGITEIAQAIETKSELEVQEYIKLLHEGLNERHQSQKEFKPVILGEIPAAAEISPKCCHALDKYAELLRLEEQLSENVAGRHKHYDMWIVDQGVAEELDEQIQSQDETFASGSSIHHTAGLLNLKSWIRLSERFLMNFGGQRLDDNWTNVAFADETPSVTADAFADFYALTVSVTRRLIHSALFFAMSRLHSMRDTGNPKAQVVKPRDVRTALDVLHMKHDRFDYWVGLARRCHLDVADLRHRKGWNSVHMDYNEVEDILSDRVPLDQQPGGRSISRHQSRDGASDDEENDHAAGVSGNGPVHTSEQLSDEEDDHAEQVDQQSSLLEEQQIWQTLGQSPPASLQSRIAEDHKRASKLRRPIGDHKTPEELVDWRNRTLYRGDWEEHGNEVFDIYEDISKHRRKRRRIEKPAVSLDVIDSSNDEISESDSNSDSDAADGDADDVENQLDAPADSTAGETDEMEIGDPEPDLPTLQQTPTKDSLATSSPSPVLSPSKHSNISIKPDLYNYDPNKYQDPPSNSEDDLPAKHERRKSYSSFEAEDDMDGIPLHSQPMSPTDWLSE
ncbi:uncharacterized protein KD926_001308 [Aspergillus affinis]|uniref:uncharacterized protein n=1 Tax=Aspergillus affinis TaxID=1070780 RepID=UPI0022FE5711|nr:uncharacterized protein KD926_001308 [Aspergillus affinis]KAI9036786.1 hypothetical protein KD926_001308 [Aspergillus affinis]